jgi:hypothetical protein
MLLIKVQLSFAFVKGSSRSLKLDCRREEYKNSQAFW